MSRVRVLYLALSLCVQHASALTQSPPTPLVAAGYSRISSSAEISADLNALAARGTGARVERLGTSVQGRPIEALVLSTRAAQDPARLVALIIGSQHGAAEPAGGEALLELARELVVGERRRLLDEIDIVFIPNANPDGRDNGRRSNANGVNINIDFVLASQPETRVLKLALLRYRPHAILDAHESAVLKRKTLATEGYLTDFNAQFEIANNPAVPAALRQHAHDVLLPALIAAVSAGGLPAQRYIGEITRTTQPITNGGLTLRNFRNTAGVTGAFSFLVETKLDSREDEFPTYRNIKERTARALLCQRVFLDLIAAHRVDLLARVEAARAVLVKEPITLFAAYAEDPAHPHLSVPLRRLDTRALIEIEFDDHRRVVTADSIEMPATYVVAEGADRVRALLDAHAIRYERLSLPFELPVASDRFAAQLNITERVPYQPGRSDKVQVTPGALLIDLVQPFGRMVPLLLDPRSTSSVFRYASYADLVEPTRDFGIHRVRKGIVTRAVP